MTTTLNQGNAGRGRNAGSRNRRTLALMELAEKGETPCAFALRIMRDDAQSHDARVMAARIAAPYVHSKPQPEPRIVAFDLPDELRSTDSLLSVHESLLRAMASGNLALEDARELSAMLETHRRLLETVDLEARIAKLEAAPL